VYVAEGSALYCESSFSRSAIFVFFEASWSPVLSSRPNSLFLHPATRERITWIRRVDADRLWRDFTLKIDMHLGH
jgi:hypothetical protein